jgi:hypothetical protein
MKMRGVFGALVVCAIAAIGLLSCGKSSTESAGTAPPPAAAPAGTPASTSAASQAVANPNATIESVEPVDLEVGRALKADGHVAESVTLFKPTDPVHIVLVSKGTVSGAKIQAVVSFQNGVTLFDSSRVVDLKGPGTMTAFEATSASGWPVGKCQLRILIGGKSYRTWDFSVK